MTTYAKTSERCSSERAASRPVGNVPSECDPTSNAFAWNELERMAHDSARDDDERERTVSFWNRHFPMMIAPNGDYDYLALALDAPDRGKIVHGSAPEWEVVTRVADSFEDWLEMLSRALTEGKGISTSRALQVMARRAP